MGIYSARINWPNDEKLGKKWENLEKIKSNIEKDKIKIYLEYFSIQFPLFTFLRIFVY
jgi:hypothetical protein